MLYQSLLDSCGVQQKIQSRQIKARRGVMAATNPIYINYTGKTTSRKFHLPLSVLKKPTNQDEYDHLESLLDQILDEVRDNENHPLAIVAQIIGDNLEDFDDSSHPPIGQN